MKYFDKDFVAFFKELSKNNNKEWFHSNKKRYEASVKEPFKNFVQALITELQKKDKTLKLEPKDCITRINRDIRFAKDKTPYNTHVSALITHGGKKHKDRPGLFIRLSAEGVAVMGGCYMPDKNQLQSIRTAIHKDNKTFNKILKSAPFKKHFGEVRGDKMKRIPKEWQEPAEKDQHILNKQFYYVAEEKANFIPTDNLFKTVMTFHKAMLPMNDFLTKAIKK